MANMVTWQIQSGKKAILRRLKNPVIIFSILPIFVGIFISLIYIIDRLSTETGFSKYSVWFVALIILAGLAVFVYRYNRAYLTNDFLKYEINDNGATLNGVFSPWSSFTCFYDQRKSDSEKILGFSVDNSGNYIIHLLNNPVTGKGKLLLFMPDEKTHITVRDLLRKKLKETNGIK